MSFIEPKLTDADEAILKQADEVMLSLKEEYEYDPDRALKLKADVFETSGDWFEGKRSKPKRTESVANHLMQANSNHEKYRLLRVPLSVRYADEFCHAFNLAWAAGVIKPSGTLQRLKAVEKENGDLKTTLGGVDKRLRDSDEEILTKAARIRYLEDFLTKNRISFGNAESGIA